MSHANFSVWSLLVDFCLFPNIAPFEQVHLILIVPHCIIDFENKMQKILIEILYYNCSFLYVTLKAFVKKESN
jgi:hypothetical protein